MTEIIFTENTETSPDIQVGQYWYKQIRRNLIDSCHNNPNRKLAEYLYGFVAKFNAIKNRY